MRVLRCGQERRGNAKARLGWVRSHRQISKVSPWRQQTWHSGDFRDGGSRQASATLSFPGAGPTRVPGRTEGSTISRIRAASSTPALEAIEHSCKRIKRPETVSVAVARNRIVDGKGALSGRQGVLFHTTFSGRKSIVRGKDTELPDFGVDCRLPRDSCMAMNSAPHPMPRSSSSHAQDGKCLRAATC
jgi:hypothetical protein